MKKLISLLVVFIGLFTLSTIAQSTTKGALTTLDTAYKPTIKMLAVYSGDNKVYYWDYVSWKPGAAPLLIPYTASLPILISGSVVSIPPSDINNDGYTAAIDFAKFIRQYAYTAKTANYSILVSDYTIDCTANSFTLTLPTAVGITGYIYEIKNTGETGGTTITIATTGGQLIDASTTQTVTTALPFRVKSTGGGWIVL